MKKLKYKIPVIATVIAVSLMLTSGNAFAWSDGTKKPIPNGETLEARIWLGNGMKFDAVTSAWLWNKKENFSYFKNIMKLNVAGIAVGIDASGPNIQGNGSSLVSMSSSSYTYYAGINSYGNYIDVGLLGSWVYVRGMSTAEVKHVGQIYSHTEDVYKYY